MIIAKEVLVIIEFFNSKNIKGMIKLEAIINLKKNVESVVAHIFLSVIFLLDSSSDTCIPNESESASAIAITSIPPSIAFLELVLEYNPIINPMVVIIPDVTPNPSPLFMCDFISLI